ncbi:MAG: alkaline phosphatase family protein [Pirellulales bacterium]
MNRSTRLLVSVVALWLVATLPPIISPVVSSAADPRLIVVVSVDQLAYEYLERFHAGLADDGFFRQVEQRGAWFRQAHHRHAYTVTAPGHAVLMTGTYPQVHGVIGNDWYDRRLGKSVYCVEDAEFPVVGAPPAQAELRGVSPRSLHAETVGDVLKRVTQGKAKVYGVTLKDRAAVLMTGARADGAYWYDANSGCWVTSRYYRSSLPDYIQALNDARPVQRYAGQAWTLLYPPTSYRHNYPDENVYEGDYELLGKSFPHALEKENLARLQKQIACTPFGNALTLELTEQLLVREQLGQDDVTDVLAVGFSSNDFVGHTYGPHSLEVEDMMYRTDRDLATLVNLLDRHVGVGRWTLALSADHAVSPIPEYAVTVGLPAQRNPLGDMTKLKKLLEDHLVAKFGALASGQPYVERLDAHQVFLRGGDDPTRFAEIQREACQVLRAQPGVALAATRDELLAATPPAGTIPAELTRLIPPGSDPWTQFRRAFHPTLSGDVVFALPPYSIQGTTKATHGTPWVYDTHVPVLFLGCGIRAVQSDQPTSPAAIGPTFARLLHIPAPAQSSEPALLEALVP